MASTDTQLKHEYELPLDELDEHGAASRPMPSSLPEPLLIENAQWFCRLRWLVVAAFGAFWCLGSFTSVIRDMGLRPGGWWPLAMGAILAAGNAAFSLHARGLERAAKPGAVAWNLWSQIALDILVLTGVVHHMGSFNTYAPFAYVLHIALACIFFSRLQALGVTALACALYVGCVALEWRGLIQPSGLYLNPELRSSVLGSSAEVRLNVSLTIAVFAVLWYLVSRLSIMVREREHGLAEANRQLVAVQEERIRHMLRTTHELKAPFAAVDANAQLLLKGHCGPLSDDALEVTARISARCRRLAAEIQEMLQLTNLRAAGDDTPEPAEVDLAEVVRWAIAQVQQVAELRHIQIEADVQPARTVGVEDHLKMLLSNLLSNAVAYSHDRSAVRVRCAAPAGQAPAVVIEDHGIGISAGKLPRVFEEYYRTDEAVRHNRASTGLGLVIAAHVARSHGVRLRVATEPGVGTRFTLTFSKSSRPHATMPA